MQCQHVDAIWVTESQLGLFMLHLNCHMHFMVIGSYSSETAEKSPGRRESLPGCHLFHHKTKGGEVKHLTALRVPCAQTKSLPCFALAAKQNTQSKLCFVKEHVWHVFSTAF